jgi:hypothetical protein
VGHLNVTVITPTIPPRGELLNRAIRSVVSQTLQPAAHLIMADIGRVGAPKMMDDCLRHARTEWVATLADDDELLPHHLQTLTDLLENTGADIAYTHFRYSNLGNGGHLEQFRGLPFDHDNPRQMTGVFMGRRQLLLDLGGHSEGFDTESYDRDSQGNRVGEDFHLVRKLAASRTPVAVSPEVTWIYHVGHVNTLGMPSAW